MIRVAVRQDDHIEIRQIFEIDAPFGCRGHGPILERVEKYRVHDAGGAFHLHQQRGMADQRDLHSQSLAACDKFGRPPPGAL